jgi:subtilisin family serine protease
MFRRNAPKYVLALLLALTVMLSLTSVTTAQQRPGRPVNTAKAELTRESAALIVANAASLPDGRIQVIVSLTEQPAVQAFINAGGRGNRAAADAAAASQKAVVLNQQANFVAQATTGLGAEVFSSTSYLTNSVTLRINPSQVIALSRLPGVSRVDADRIVERQDTVSVPFIGAGEVWGGVGGGTEYTGAGVVIAVIDSGIDYIHTHFGGSGDYADNPSDTDGTDSPFFPSTGVTNPGDPKVVGGHDYVGNDFDSTGDQGSPIPAPDADPIDCPIEDGGGHGTHVAGTAAGWGVNADGTTYEGPFNDEIFTDFPDWTEAFRIGPGVAPEAELVALRVFGCNGSTYTSLVVAGIDDAVAGTYGPVADVINMSLGSFYGTADPAFVENVAIANASAAGTIVVMSAGNNGDFFFVSGSPGAANEGLAIASSVDPGNQGRGVRNDSVDEVYPAAYGASSPFIHDPVTAPLERPLVDTTTGFAQGCLATDFDNFTPGNIALVDRGTCNFSVKQDNAFAAGAAGLIVANIPTSPNPESLVTMAEATNPNYNIPTVHVALTPGNALRTAANGTNTATLDWTLATFSTETADTLSGFSSRGPTRQNANSFKPDLAAPGNTILSAGSGTGEYTYNISGTSMASPHVAGSMALLREKYPDWSVEDLKALVMNTAVNPVFQGTDIYGPQRVGSGRIDLVNTFTGGEVVAYNTLNPAGVSVSFGFPEVLAGDTLDLTRTITLENKTATDVTYDVSFTQGTDMVGVDLEVTEPTITVAANSTATVTVNLTGDPAAAGVNANSDPTLATANRHYLTEESGWVEFDPTSGSEAALRVSVYAAPRAVSDMSGSIAAAIEDNAGTTTIDLSGTELFTGPNEEDLISVVSAFELVASSPDEAGTPNNADLAYFGIANDYALAEEGEGYVYFGIATHGAWNSLNEVQFAINLDPDMDGDADFIIINDSATGAFDTFTVEFVDVFGVLGGAPGDVYSFTPPVLPNFFPGSLNTYLFNTHVVFLPFPMELLVGTGEFHYWVETYSLRYEDPATEVGLVVDTLGSALLPLHYDPENALYNFTDADEIITGLPAALDLDGGAITLAYDFPMGEPVVIPDVLLLHHHNASGNRAEVVDVVVPQPAPFTLVSPADDTVLDTVAEIQAFTSVVWTESAGAESYTFELLKPDGSDVTLSGLTGAADADGLTCDGTNCTLTIADALTLLDQNGVYTWNVYAFIGAGWVGATNNPFTFEVNLPAPAQFALLTPADDAVITDPASVTAITWSASDVASYQFLLFKISTNPRADVGPVLDLTLTAAADSDPLTCDTSVCTLTVGAAEQALLTDGFYSWTVIALSNVDVEASNAPFTFRVNTGDVDLLVNGGFEEAGDSAGDALNWDVKNKSGDKRKEDPTKAYSGNAFFQFKGKAGENSKLQQKVESNPLFMQVGVGEGDVLNGSVFVNTEIAAPGKLTIKVKYEDATAGTNGDGKDKVVIDLAATTGYQEVTASLTAADTVTKLRFVINFKSTSGKMLVDEASLIRAAAAPSPSFGTVEDSLPLPPEPSFSGRN